MKLGAVAVAGVLLVLLWGAQGEPPALSGASGARTLPDEVIVAREDLVKRTEITPDDFRTPAPKPPVIEVRPAPDAVAELDDRRRRRRDDPDDLRAHRTRSKPAGGNKRARAAEPRTAPGGVQYRFVRFDEDAPTTQHAPDGRPVLAAGAVVKATLRGRLTVRNGRAPVALVVGAGQGVPKGSKLVGRATATRDGLVQIDVRSLVLPDGQELRVDATVVGDDGAAGLVGTVVSGADDDSADDGSVAGDVADGTVDRAGRALLGDGIVGGAFGDARRSSRRRGRRTAPREPLVVTLEPGTQVRVFFGSSVTP